MPCRHGDFLGPVAGAQLRQHVLLGPRQALGAGEHLHRERLAAGSAAAHDQHGVDLGARRAAAASGMKASDSALARVLEFDDAAAIALRVLERLADLRLPAGIAARYSMPSRCASRAPPRVRAAPDGWRAGCGRSGRPAAGRGRSRRAPGPACRPAGRRARQRAANSSGIVETATVGWWYSMTLSSSVWVRKVCENPGMPGGDYCRASCDLFTSAGEPLQGFAVLGGGLLDHLGRQARRRRRLVPGLAVDARVASSQSRTNCLS